MSSHRLTALEQAALAVLTGTPVPAAAMHASLTADEVATAAARYQSAGRAALTSMYADDWYQVNIEFADPSSAEAVAVTELLPQLQHAHEDGHLGSWWYIRKTPYWRFRLHTDPRRMVSLRTLIGAALDDLAARRLIIAWTEGVYEPEAYAFGGQAAMGVAHRFFYADSLNILTHLGRTRFQPDLALGLREMSLLACAALLRAAGQDWHEQGDVWHRVASMRTLDSTVPREHIDALTGKLHPILALDPEGEMTSGLGGSLQPVRPWLAAANSAGEALRDLARLGQLRRGQRDVLAHHIIFHWNRLGLAHIQQAVLAHAAAFAILTPPQETDGLCPARIAHVAET